MYFFLNFFYNITFKYLSQFIIIVELILYVQLGWE